MIEKLLKLNQKSGFLWVLGGFTVMLSVFLVIYGLLAAPVADDWTYHNFYTLGISEYISMAMGHTGRLFQWLAVYVGYWLFDMKAVKIMPVVFFLMLSASLYWTLRVTKIGHKNDLGQLVLSFLVASFVMLLQPSVFDVYLWLTSSTVYILSTVFLFLNFTFLYILLTKKVKWPFVVLAYLSFVVGQTFSEPTSALMIGLALLALTVAVWKGSKKQMMTLATTLVSLVGGFLIVYLSPGSVARRVDSPEFDFSWVFIDSLDGYMTMFSGTWLWVLALPIVFLAFFLLTGKFLKIKKPIWLLVSAVIVFLATTYPVFALNNFTQGYVPDRIFALPVTGAIVSVVLVAIYVSLRVGSSEKIRGIASAILTLLVIVAVPMSLYGGVSTIARLSLRDKVSKDREYVVSEQISSSTRPITIMKAPILLRGNGDDFYYGEGRWDINGRNWIVNSFLKYKGLEPSGLSEDDVALVDPPGFYR